MRLAFKNFLILMVFFCIGCNAKKPEQPISKEHSLTIIHLGPEYKEFNKVDTKGFGIHYYYYINLNTDSVFLRVKDDQNFPFTVKINAGLAKGISKTPPIKSALEELKNAPMGFSKNNTKETCFKSTQRPIYILYKKGAVEKHFFFCRIYSTSAIDDLIGYLFRLNKTYNLKEVSEERFFNEDSILKSVITAEGIDSLYPPIPHIKSTIKFTPPLKGYEKDSDQNP